MDRRERRAGRRDEQRERVVHCSTAADCPQGGPCQETHCTGGVCGTTALPDGMACLDAPQVCKGGVCECPAEDQCDTGCFDTKNDPANCGLHVASRFAADAVSIYWSDPGQNAIMRLAK